MSKSPAQAPTVFAHVEASSVNPLLKQVAREVGDKHWRRAGSHGPRRGAACDMARNPKSRLKDILRGGDWRSEAFRTYLESVREDLAGRAMIQLLGECSDSEDESGERV